MSHRTPVRLRLRVPSFPALVAAPRSPRSPRWPGVLAIVMVSALALVGGLALAPQRVGAQQCSAIDRIGTSCSLIDELDPPRPAPGGGAVVTSSAPPGPRFVWLNLLAACDAAGGGGWTPIGDLSSAILDLSFLASTAPAEDPGVLWIGELVDPVSGGTNSGFIACIGEGEGRPPLPPPLPAAEEIWGAALTFEPAVNLDPYVRGLTGLETYMWYEGPVSDAVAITLNGYAVTATITAVEFRWDMGGDARTGDRAYASGQPGSADAPAASHTYAQPASVVITHEVAWTGTSVLTGPGLPPGGVAVDLGEAVVATARDYDVIEVRTPVISGADGD